MKKSVIAGAGLSALAMAAMPFAGVFAAKTTELVDTLEVTIPESCTITTTATGATTETVTEGTAPNETTFIRVTNPTIQVTMANGQLLTEIGNGSGGTSETDPQEQPTDTGSSISVVCNNTPAGQDPENPDYTAENSWKLMAKGTSGTTLAPEGAGTAIAAGTATSGATSNWAYRVIGGTSEAYAAITASDVEVARGVGNTATPLKMRYQVYISPTQEADVYTGSVTYSLYSPAQE